METYQYVFRQIQEIDDGARALSENCFRLTRRRVQLLLRQKLRQEICFITLSCKVLSCLAGLVQRRQPRGKKAKSQKC
jgi:hypothetical protein